MYFDLPKRTIRKNSNKIILFNKTIKTKKTYTETPVDMIYDDFKESYRKSWENDYNYLLLIDLKRENKEDIVFVLKVRTRI